MISSPYLQRSSWMRVGRDEITDSVDPSMNVDEPFASGGG